MMTHGFSISHWHTLQTESVSVWKQKNQDDIYSGGPGQALGRSHWKVIIVRASPCQPNYIIYREKDRDRDIFMKDHSQSWNWVRHCSHCQDHSTTSKLSCHTCSSVWGEKRKKKKKKKTKAVQCSEFYNTCTHTHTSLKNKSELDLASCPDSWSGALKKTGVEMSSVRKDCLRCSLRCAANRWMKIIHQQKKNNIEL